MLEAAGHAPIGMFELSKVGVPVAIVGIAVLIVLSPLVVPERRAASAQLAENVREFAVQMVVVEGGPLDGRSVEAGGLRHLQGVFLIEVERDGQLIAPVAPTFVLQRRDVLTFVGKADLVVDLQGQRGLASAEGKHLGHFDTTRHTFFEVVVGASSPLVGSTLRDSDFRNRYQAAVVAIHRSGHRVREKLGAVQIKLGDTLMLLTDPGFQARWRDRDDFLLVARLGGAAPAASRKAPLVAVITLAIVVVAGAGALPILHAALLGAIALVVLGVLTPGEARSAVDLDTVLVIGGAFGLGNAIAQSGLAERLAASLVGAFSSFGPQGVLLGIVVATLVLTELITNNAAAALLFPIGLATAARLGADPRPFAIAIAVAASLSFLTPIGYQTNTMVYGLGGYRFGDYARLGLPLTILATAVLLLAVPLFWPLVP